MSNFKRNVLTIFILAILLSFSNTNPEVIPREYFPVELRPAFERKFKSPVFLTPFPGGKARNRIAILEKRGKIWLIEKQRDKESIRLFLDVESKTLSAGWEEGALGLTFAPDFEKSGRYYVYSSRSSPRRTVLSRFTLKYPAGNVSLDALQTTAIEEEILSIRQPFANHNGGMIEFGPDGMLYIGVGDGGSGGDPRGYAQNRYSLLGKILRLDVSGKKGYRIPPDNPFAFPEKTGNEVKKKNRQNCPDDLCREEIYAWGLRNPWRFTVLANGDLIVGDVGQNLYEEIASVRSGENHGWNIFEASHCYKGNKRCRDSGFTMPIHEYDHNEGTSILGGYQYNGSELATLRKQYIFGDSMTGKIWALNLSSPKKSQLIHQAPFLISSFGVDHQNELYALDLNGGKIYKMVKSTFRETQKANGR
ncbi:MAG: PQQ-dependent sugar dehydrogenase [Leptospiraceae bacterium]|nr:PQQ-dependent sugar dehydrogenase [Leptospiraceae bacterium]